MHQQTADLIAANHKVVLNWKEDVIPCCVECGCELDESLAMWSCYCETCEDKLYQKER